MNEFKMNKGSEVFSISTAVSNRKDYLPLVSNYRKGITSFHNYDSPFIPGSRFRRSGWNYQCEVRNGDVTLCRQFSDTRYEKESGFVVCIIRIKKRRVLPTGKVLGQGEVFPSPSRFGKDGFFFMLKPNGYSLALNKMKELSFHRGFAWEPLGTDNLFHQDKIGLSKSGGKIEYLNGGDRYAG